MSRELSLPARRAAYASRTDEVFLTLLRISHPDFATTYGFVDNTKNIISRGIEYIAYPFRIELPQDDPEQLPEVTLEIDNVAREIMEVIRSIASPPTVEYEVILASSPDVVEAGPFEMRLTKADYDALVVQGTLGFEPVLTAPFPGHTYNPADYPGLF